MDDSVRLEAERRYYRELFEQAPDGHLVTDLAGTIRHANRAAGRLLKTAPEALAGRPLEEFVAEPEREVFRAEVPRAAERANGDSPHEWEVNLHPAGGEDVPVRFLVTAVRDAAGTPEGLHWAVRDITRLKEAQVRALQAGRLAAIGEMVAGLAHESGNALQRAQANLERLALRVKDRPEAQGLIADIQGAQDHLRHLYGQLRTYAGPVKIDPQPCQLADIWREAWAQLEHQRQGRRADLHEEVECHDLAGVLDGFALCQVFRNVLENSLAACPDPVEVRLSCREAELEGRPALTVSVRDNGPGLNAEQRRRIFEPFFTTRTRGTGLGMAIAKRIVEAHGGAIAVSDASPGAEVVITLPWRKP